MQITNSFSKIIFFQKIGYYLEFFEQYFSSDLNWGATEKKAEIREKDERNWVEKGKEGQNRYVRRVVGGEGGGV